MYKITIACLLILGFARVSYQIELEFDNEYRENLNFQCDRNYAIQALHSKFSSFRRDRKWKLVCTKIPGVWGQCISLAYTTPGASMISKYCTGGRVLRGLRSEYDTDTKDRRWSLRCCKSSEYDTTRCKSRIRIHEIKQDMLFVAPYNNIVNGIIGSFDSVAKDREWYIGICELKKK